MSKLLTMLVALAAVGMFIFSACDDDNNNGTGGNNAAALDCDAHGQDVTKCDAAICALQGTTGDSCYDTYRDCYMTACPSGTDAADADANALLTCGTDYGTCTTSGGDGDSDSDTDGDADGDADGDSDSDADADPFTGIDCDSTDTNSCDYSICAVKTAYDALASMDCSTMQAYCDGVTACYGTYVTCMTEVCPAGTTVDTNNATAMSACASDVSTCTMNVPMTK